MHAAQSRQIQQNQSLSLSYCRWVQGCSNPFTWSETEKWMVLYCIVLFCIDAKLCWDSKFPCFTDFLHTVSLCEYEQSRINDPILLKNILTHIKMKQHKNCILI